MGLWDKIENVGSDAWTWLDSILRPGKYYQQAAGNVSQVADQFKQLAADQRGFQLAGLERALPYLQQTQNAYNAIYGRPGTQQIQAPQNPLASLSGMMGQGARR